jgi:hypothetical protein
LTPAARGIVSASGQDFEMFFECPFLSVATMTEAISTRSRRGSETRKKTIPVTTRYDAAEFAELDEAASRAGLTRASFQRVQSLATTPKTRSTRRAPIEREALAKILGALGKIGGNMNQIAHASHLGLGVEAQLVGTMKDLRATLPVMLEALGRKS